MPHADGTVSVTVNGRHRRVAAGLTLARLASDLGLVPEQLAVERNAVEVPSAALGDTPVEDGDDIEMVSSMGSGGAAD